MADWSELPLDLLQLISNLTNINSSDTRHLRSVCSSWRYSIPPKPSTYFLPPTMKFLSSQTHCFEFRLVKQTTFLLSPSFDTNFCWVVKVEEHKPGVFQLLSPFSKSTYLKEFSHNILDLTNINTLELGHKYVLRNINGNNNNNNNNNNNANICSNDMEHEKIAFISGDENDNITLISTHNSTGKLLMYTSSSKDWAFLDDLALGYNDIGEHAYDSSLHYVDVVLFEGIFYAITNSGRTVTIEFVDQSSIVVNLMVKSIIGGDKKYLVKSNEDLLLIDLYTCPVKGSFEVNAIEVYKFDKEEQKWVLLTSLGGRTIFLSKNSSFCGSSLVGLKENYIYFSFKEIGKDFSEKKSGSINESEGCYNEDEVESNELEVFNYDKGNFGSFEENEDSKSFCSSPPWINLLF